MTQSEINADKCRFQKGQAEPQEEPQFIIGPCPVPLIILRGVFLCLEGKANSKGKLQVQSSGCSKCVQKCM